MTGTLPELQLLVESPTGAGSGNQQKAADYGTATVTEAAFLIGIGIPASLISADSHAWAKG